MFGKLINRFQDKKVDHPLGSAENLDALLATIATADPSHLLLEINEWLSGMDQHLVQIGPAAAALATLRFDESAQAAVEQLLLRYLDPQRREYQTEAVWQILERLALNLQNSSRLCLQAVDKLEATTAERHRRVRLLAIGLRAWALRKKLLRFRYRAPDADYWREGHELLRLVSPEMQIERVHVQRGEPVTTPLHEYLVGLYFEFIPVGNLVPQQLEALDRFLRSQALELTDRPHAGTTHHIDLAATVGPQRHTASSTGEKTMRYCSTGKLRADLMRFALQVKKGQHMIDWLIGVPATSDMVANGLLLLSMYWAPTPPQRSTKREPAGAELKVVFGFGLARRMISCSQYARSGQSLGYEATNMDQMFYQNRFGVLDNDARPKNEVPDITQPEIVEPMDVLQRLELAGDKAQMEIWKQVDQSANGIGATPPAILNRHRIGSLIALRNTDELFWRLAIVRRIGRDPQNRPNIGVDTLPMPSLCALARQVEQSGGTSDTLIWADAIVVEFDIQKMLLPLNAFAAGKNMDVRSEEGLWRVRLVSLIERGPDFEYVEFERIS